jgi:hypothetical protein
VTDKPVVTITRTDLLSLTVGEIEAAEELVGLPFDEMFRAGKPRGKPMRALAFVIVRRDRPELTWEEVGDMIVRAELGVEPDPSAPGSSGGGPGGS